MGKRQFLFYKKPENSIKKNNNNKKHTRTLRTDQRTKPKFV